MLGVVSSRVRNVVEDFFAREAEAVGYGEEAYGTVRELASPSTEFEGSWAIGGPT